ncbi:MAG: TonB family protein [Thermoanaerobaculia bacterium]
MTTPQVFGDYLLFRKLATDALGDTYRAGKRGPQGIDRVVLLRQFNAGGVDRAALAAALAERRGVHKVLQNPHIGEGVEAGKIGETPFASWEYISGKNLRELLNETLERSFPLPIEHALFIAERITFGLTAAYATRHHDSRVHHGFLVPELVELSNEGEVRVLGFEAGQGLRRSLESSGLRQALGRYLAPEVGPGTAPSSAEDVFSLGAILFEMLTGQPLVSPPDGDYEILIDQATVAADESPLPPSIRALLKSSLARREERIADVQQWQQALSRFIAEGPHNPTSFNLAFFMHSLFRGDIERETEELERERQTQVSVEAEAPAVEAQRPQASSSVLVPPSAAVAAATASDSGHYGKAGGKRGGLIAAALGLVALAGLGIAYFVRGGGDEAAAPSTEVVAEASMPASDPLDIGGAATPDAAQPNALDDTAAAVQTEAAAPGAAPEELVAEAIQDLELDAQPPGNLARRRAEQKNGQPSQEEMQDQIRKLVEARAEEMEGTLQQRYEEELEALRQQLDEAKKAQEAEAAPAEEPEAATVAEQPAQPEAQAAAAQQQVAVPQAEVRTPQPGPVTQTITPTPEPEPVAAGELVEIGPGVTPPRIVDRPSPRYPPSARRLGKVATVQLRVLVDENGRVIETEQAGSKVGFGFDQEALSAARETTWRPAMKSGVPVKMWVDLRIEFRP